MLPIGVTLRGKKRKVVCIGVFLAGCIIAGVLSRAPILTWLGGQLIRSDNLEQSDAIVILSGGEFAEREIEGADLYRAGFAPRVAISVGREAPGAKELARRGVGLSDLLELRLYHLEGVGVPRSAISLLPGRASSTRDEAVMAAEWSEANDVTSLIVVTSAYHTARAGFIFERIFDRQPVRISLRPSGADDFRADSWWKERTTLRNGIFELQRTLFYWLAY